MKIGVVGCGHVGSASAYACVLRGVGTQIVLVDRDEALARAQAGDILHATPFAAPVPVSAGDFSDLEGAGIVMVAAGVAQKSGESRLDLLRRNADVFADIVPKILKSAPGAILLIATNPVDIMTHRAARIAGTPDRIIGSGTILDTARFRSLLARHLGVSSHSVHAHVLGEHGDSEVLHWSGANVSNVPVAGFAAQVDAPVTEAVRREIDDAVRCAAYRIIEGKGATWYGIGAGMARIAQAILDDERAVLTCSALVKGIGEKGDVTLSLPHVIGAGGIVRTIYPELDANESAALARSATILGELVDQL